MHQAVTKPSLKCHNQPTVNLSGVWLSRKDYYFLNIARQPAEWKAEEEHNSQDRIYVLHVLRKTVNYAYQAEATCQRLPKKVVDGPSLNLISAWQDLASGQASSDQDEGRLSHSFNYTPPPFLLTHFTLETWFLPNYSIKLGVDARDCQEIPEAFLWLAKGTPSNVFICPTLAWVLFVNW